MNRLRLETTAIKRGSKRMAYVRSKKTVRRRRIYYVLLATIVLGLIAGDINRQPPMTRFMSGSKRRC